MVKFKSMVDNPERLAEFRRYCSESKEILSKREGRVVIPLVAIIEGGVRIPMSDLLTNFLHHFKVCPDQCTPNVFRIVSSVDTLNKRLKLKLIEHDINYTYSFQDSKTSRFYFKIWHKEVRLISSLSDFGKEREGDYLIVLGNWYPGWIHYPQVQVKHVGRFYRIFFLLTYYLWFISFSSYPTHSMWLTFLVSFLKDYAFKRKRQLINSTDLNRLLRSPIYPHPDGQLRATYLILGYSPVYQSFQAARKAITIKHPLLPYIDVRYKGYILSPSECACREEGRYQSKSPPSFTLEDLGVTIVVPTPTDHP